MPLNVKLLKKIKKHITEKPRRFVMRTFIVRVEDRAGEIEAGMFQNDGGTYTKFETCGTAACIAGWAVLLTDGMQASPQNIRDRAIEVLGLQRDDGMGRDDIFEAGEWPREFSEPYFGATTQQRRVAVAAKFIDFLIEHGPEPLELD